MIAVKEEKASRYELLLILRPRGLWSTDLVPSLPHQALLQPCQIFKESYSYSIELAIVQSDEDLVVGLGSFEIWTWINLSDDALLLPSS